jgi:hypothetical protein
MLKFQYLIAESINTHVWMILIDNTIVTEKT